MQSTLTQTPPGFEPFIADRIETIRVLWDKWKLFPMLFDDSLYPPYLSDEENFHRFVNWVMQPTTLLYHYKDQGMIGVFHAQPNYKANVVVLFWDRKLYGSERIAIARHGAQFIVRLLNLHRLNAHIWSRNTASIQFSLKTGFLHEGTLKGSWSKNGVWYDSVLLGAVASDILSWPSEPVDAVVDELFDERSSR